MPDTRRYRELALAGELYATPPLTKIANWGRHAAYQGRSPHRRLQAVMATSLAAPVDDALGAVEASAIVIDIPAAVGIRRKPAPAVFDAAGADLDPVTVPPDQADLTPRARRIATDGTGDPSFPLFKTGAESYGHDTDIDIDTSRSVAIGMFPSMAGLRAAVEGISRVRGGLTTTLGDEGRVTIHKPPGQSPIDEN
ncbi:MULTISPECIES: hypothetical protein [unclassified Pseudofrankia]|uniref:hypothetical protein n=1 Tax=unclassified Pseudofrankia TaxID=2994372 RepID=UPI0008D8D64B|nr:MULTISPECIES: hypothetical protein [unclassified Pseudofrankia]MDT3443325.1 hypothetical protein [Pseudofrankia sp. BMG5.37]OHV65341.1 hypothetical protein BCD48_04460 [Pseudofrankia sp. BMG5.36]